MNGGHRDEDRRCACKPGDAHVPGCGITNWAAEQRSEPRPPWMRQAVKVTREELREPYKHLPFIGGSQEQRKPRVEVHDLMVLEGAHDCSEFQTWPPVTVDVSVHAERFDPVEIVAKVKDALEQEWKRRQEVKFPPHPPAKHVTPISQPDPRAHNHLYGTCADCRPERRRVGPFDMLAAFAAALALTWLALGWR